jgi:ribosomal protein S12 methylthiotransferase
VLVDQSSALGRKGARGRSYAEAPEIDGTVYLLPPTKASTQVRAGDFVRARVVAARGHDLVAQPL